MWIGKSRNLQKDCKISKIKWPQNPIKCLGIYLGGTAEERKKLNWTDKIDKMNTTLQKWKKRDLTLIGKVQILNSSGSTPAYCAF